MNTRNKSNSSIFTRLPKDLKQSLCRFLDTNSFINLMHADPEAFVAIYSDLAQRRDFPLRRLLSHAALGEWEAAEAIWSANPFLLTLQGTVYHPNRTYEQGAPPVAISPYHNPGRYKYKIRTAFQIALMNEEYDEVDRMCESMSEGDARRQFFEVFPDGEIKKYNWDIDHAKALLVAVYAAVINDELIKDNSPALVEATDDQSLDVMHDATRAALYALYDYIKPAPEHDTGLVFDINLYLEALRLYDENAKQTVGKFQNNSQKSFWRIRVEEYIAALLGTRYLRPHAQSLRRIISGNIHRRGCLFETSLDHEAESQQEPEQSIFAFRQKAGRIAGRHFFLGCGGIMGHERELYRERRIKSGEGRGERSFFVVAATPFSFLQDFHAKTTSAANKLCQRFSVSKRQKP